MHLPGGGNFKTGSGFLVQAAYLHKHSPSVFDTDLCIPPSGAYPHWTNSSFFVTKAHTRRFCK